MYSIHLTNSKKRDATLGFEAKPTRKRVFQVLGDGSPKHNVKILRATPQTDLTHLVTQYDDLEALGQAIIESDVEIDLERSGKIIDGLKKIYVDEANRIVFNVSLIEIVHDKDGIEKQRRPYVPKTANIAAQASPLIWSGKMIPKADAAKKFVFSKHYQIKHVNGLTYDYLYDMAKELDQKNGLMFVGAGPKGNEPLIVTAGGTPYRGFLEGRIQGDKYMLILHLTQLELKALP